MSVLTLTICYTLIWTRWAPWKERKYLWRVVRGTSTDGTSQWSWSRVSRIFSGATPTLSAPVTVHITALYFWKLKNSWLIFVRVSEFIYDPTYTIAEWHNEWHFVAEICCGQSLDVVNADYISQVMYPGQSLKYTCTPGTRFLDGFDAKYLYCDMYGYFKGITSDCRGLWIYWFYVWFGPEPIIYFSIVERCCTPGPWSAKKCR